MTSIGIVKPAVRNLVAVVVSAVSIVGLTALHSANASTTTSINIPSNLPTTGTTGIGVFYGQSCTSAGNCVAVGNDSSTNEPMYATESSGVWGSPIDLATKGAWGLLESVSCPSVGNCVAVGEDVVNYSGVPYYVTEVNGTWGTPTDAADGGLPGYFTSVSCPSSGQCTAIGLNAFTNLPFAVSVQNGSWGSPAYVSFGVNSTDIGILNSVSCVSAGNCVAVGYIFGSTKPTYVIESGGTWGVIATSGLTGQLNAISCSSSTDCLAVGQNATTDEPWYLAEVGGVWSSAPTDLHAASNLGTFLAVSCMSAGNCGVVGKDESNPTAPIVVNEVNGVFAAPADLAASQGILYAVSCASPGSCESVGTDARPLVANETAGAWATPVEDPTTQPSGHGQFNAVSCSSDGNCVAVGEDLATNVPIINSEANGTWGPPLEAAPSSSADIYTSVSCPSQGNCVVVGYRQGNSALDEPIVKSEVNGVWSPTSLVPSPGINGVFNGVSCSSAGTCVAVGQDTSNNNLLYDVEVNGTWNVPVDVAAPHGTGLLNAVSCPSSGDCVAVGLDVGDQDPVSLSQVNGVWAAPADDVFNFNANNTRVSGEWQFNGVSCPTAENCVAVGGGPNGSIQSTENNGVLSAPVALVLKTGSDSWNVTAVSCPSVGNCVVTGTDNFNSGPLPVASSFEDTQANGKWQPAVSVSGVLSVQSTMSGVSCPASGACLLVGKDGGNLEPLFDAFFTSQPVLTITNVTTSGTAGTPINVVVSGGSVASPSITVTGPGCSVSGLFVRASGAGTCVVTANVASNSFFSPAQSMAKAFTFSLARQLALKVTTRLSHGVVTLGTSGGSGSGTVTYKVSGAGCVLHAHRLSGAMGSHCRVIAHKAARGIYAAATSRSQAVVFAR